MKNKLDILLDKLDNPLFSTIREQDLDNLAIRYLEDEQ